jgi:hypothetical protein
MSQDFNGQSKWVTTRKTHVCDMCGGPIPIQETAHYHANVYDGEFNAGWQHRECWESYFTSGDEEWEYGSYPWPERITVWWKENEKEWEAQRKRDHPRKAAL